MKHIHQQISLEEVVHSSASLVCSTRVKISPLESDLSPRVLARSNEQSLNFPILGHSIPRPSYVPVHQCLERSGTSIQVSCTRVASKCNVTSGRYCVYIYIYIYNIYTYIYIYIICDSCNIGTSDLPDIYT